MILNQTADREGVLIDAIRACQKEGYDVDEEDVKLLPFLDRLLDTCTNQGEVLARVRDPELADKVAALFSQYRSELERENRLDFPCLLAKAIEIMEGVSGVAKLVRTAYRHVCVDEFQDTNFAQYRFLRAIAGMSPRHLFVVADDDQIIYQWNGASPERLEELRRDFDMKILQLPANYRCPPSVIALANKLIRHNLLRSADKEALVAVKEDEDASAVRVHHFRKVNDELAWVANDIAQRSETERGRCAILGRNKRVLEGAMMALGRLGVPGVLHSRKDEFETPPFRWLHAALRLANARGDREQVRRMCKAFHAVEGLDLRVEQVTASAAVTGGDLLRAWFDEALARELSDLTREYLVQLRSRIVTRLQFREFIELALDWFEKMRADTTRMQDAFDEFESEVTAWREVVQSIVERLGAETLTLEALLQEMDLASKSPPPPPNAVRCLTIHSSKGMEFGHVYVVALAEDQLPSFQAVKKGPQSRELQEERRNCFVAITRAIVSLTLTYADEYWGWRKAPSRFLAEMELTP